MIPGREEAARRLAAAPGADALVVRIGEGDYGCEEPGGTPMLWLLLQTANGQTISRELPEARAAALGLTEGGVCRLADLHD
ncbi:hypothetical protein [Dysosmobacter sp.]